MKILYICHRIPYPPNKGDKIRAFHQVRAIAARHEVDVFTLVDDARDLAHQSALLRSCHRLTVARLDPRVARLRALPFLLTRLPLTVPYFYSAKLQREVRKALLSRSYDRVFVYCSAMAQYVEPLDGIPIVTDFVDVDSDKWRQYALSSRMPFSALYRREGRTLRAYERQVCERSSCTAVTTEREARLLREIAGDARIHVIPNGVDTEYFQLPEARPDPSAPVVGFTGDMGYFPNEEAVTYFARRVLPLIHKVLPEVRFLVVGRNPSRNVQRLSEIEGVEVTGFVPDVRTCLAKIHVSVAPFSIAAGIQNKILEAMASGIPVVGTSRAVQGLSSAAAGNVDVADTCRRDGRKESCSCSVTPNSPAPRAWRVGGKSRRSTVGSGLSTELLNLLEDPAGAELSLTSVDLPRA